MSTNPSTPDPSHQGDASGVNSAITEKLRSYRRRGRLLTIAALSVGILAIVAGVLLGWASAYIVMPMERLLIQEYPNALATKGSKPAAIEKGEPAPPISRAELDLCHVQVTAAHGKALFITATAVVLQGFGTLLTLLLVIFNRQVTLRQINANLELISSQIRASQGGKS
jgi:hypothetical protein